MDENLKQIIFNVVGGALVALLGWIFAKLRQKYYKHSFKQIFGKDSEDNFILTYGRMKLLTPYDEKGEIRKWPYYNKSPDASFNVSSVVSLAGAKSIHYLSELFGRIVNSPPRLLSDEEIEERLDISFCSIGGLNNLKTKDLLRSKENIFYDFDRTGPEVAIISKTDKTKRFSIDRIYDFAFIIKVIPKNFPNRVWIAVAGLGEWGTTGATWFLMKHWQKMPKNKSFGMIIKVRGGQDESAERIETIIDQEC
ncbi:MAG: hypothetical protein Q7S12_04385 [bacterium]|nr:hypothetical protein [bacterium]